MPRKRDLISLRMWMMYAYHNCWQLLLFLGFISISPKGTVLSKQYRSDAKPVYLQTNRFQPISVNCVRFFFSWIFRRGLALVCLKLSWIVWNSFWKVDKRIFHFCFILIRFTSVRFAFDTYFVHKWSVYLVGRKSAFWLVFFFLNSKKSQINHKTKTTLFGKNHFLL